MSDSTIQHQATEAHAGEEVLEHGAQLNHARRRLFPHALIVGLATGTIAIAFRVCLDQGEKLRDFLLGWTTTRGMLGFAALCTFTMGLVGAALWLIRRFCPEASGSGIPHLRIVLQEEGRVRWRRVLPVKFLSGLFAITSGLCLGREGPTIQMGAALGSMWGESTMGKGTDRRSLLVTGASAGLAAAFNAPMAGMLFAMEELHINIPNSAFFASMISCIVADLMGRCVLGQMPVLHVVLDKGPPPLDSIPFFLVLGAITGVFSWLFNSSLVFTTRQLNFNSTRANVIKVVTTGLILAAVGWISPKLLGGGLALSNAALRGDGTLAWLATMLLLRFILSIGSYAIGTAGGIFAPLLVLGGLLGLMVGDFSHRLIPSAVPELGAFAVVGMGAMFAGVVRCPLTGIVLIIEMTGHYELVMPLMIASFTAAIVADELLVPPVYDALLKNQLAARKDAAGSV